EDVPRRRRTRAELALYPTSREDVLKRSRTGAELALIPPLRNPYARYADFLWGSQDFNSDTKFSGGRKVWSTSTNPHTKKIRETHRKLLGLPLSWERAKDWRRQKANRMLKAGIKVQEHTTITGRVISTRRNQFMDVESRKFKELVQKNCEVMFLCKKAYILNKWYELSDEQKRFYLDWEDQEELPDFEIPKVELEVTQDNQTTVQPILQFTVVISIVSINRQAYGRYNVLTERRLTVQDRALAIPHQSLTEQEESGEGGADNCLSNEDIGVDIEEDYDDKPNKQDDDEDIGAWYKREASESSSEKEEEAQLTESDSNERRVKKLVRAKIIEGLLLSDTEDNNYRNSTEEDDGEVNE
ncbi:hypothetical protein L211DRAFT_854629, partial [Terfezia boudieri ATCC MYA-4762]